MLSAKVIRISCQVHLKHLFNRGLQIFRHPCDVRFSHDMRRKSLPDEERSHPARNNRSRTGGSCMTRFLRFQFDRRNKGPMASKGFVVKISY